MKYSLPQGEPLAKKCSTLAHLVRLGTRVFLEDSAKSFRVRFIDCKISLTKFCML